MQEYWEYQIRNTTKNYTMRATKTLYTAHLGTLHQKYKLTSSILGISSDIVKEVINLSRYGKRTVRIINKH